MFVRTLHVKLDAGSRSQRSNLQRDRLPVCDSLRARFLAACARPRKGV